MNRTSQPAMRPPAPGMRPERRPAPRPEPQPPVVQGSRPDLGPEDRSGAIQALKKSSAFTRWAILVACVGLGTAAVIGIAATAFFTLVDSSL